MLSLRALLLGLVTASAVSAGEPASLAQLLPPNTPVFFESRNPPLEELKKLAIFECLNEPVLQKALAGLAAGENSLTAQAIPLGSAGVVLQSDFRDMSMTVRYMDKRGPRSFKFRERFGFAWIGVVQGPIPVDALAAIEANDPAKALDTIQHIIAAASLVGVEAGKGESVQERIGRIFSTATHREREYSRLDIDGMSFFLGNVGKLLIATTTEARMRECIDRQMDGAAGSLAESKRYKDMVSLARGTGPATTIFAIQIDHALDVLEQVFPQPIAMARMSLGSVGLGALQSVTSVSRIEGRGITNTVSVLVDKEQAAGSPLLQPGKPARHTGLAFAPKDTFYVNSGSLDLSGIYAMYGAALEPWFQQTFGLRLKEDLIDLIGPEMALIVSPNQGLIPDIAIVMESKDAARLAESLNKMAGQIPWPPGTGIHSAKILGADAYVMPLGHPRLAQIPIAPTFAGVDGHLLITPSPMAFQGCMAVQRGEKDSITASRDFAQLREMVPEHAESMSYLNLPRLVGFLYDTLVPILQGLPQQLGGPGALFELPEAEVFTRHLYGRIAWTQTDDRGLHWVSHSPVDLSGMLFGTVVFGGVTWFYLSREAEHMPPPTIGGPKHDHEAMNCQANVRILSARLRYYRRQHKQLPASLDDLKARHLPEDTFIVPGTDKSYVYLGPKGRGAVLLHGYPNGKDQGVCVLTKRMKVIRVTQKRLSEMLSKQSASKPR